MGGIFEKKGDLTKAKEFYEKFMNLKEELVKTDPTNASLKRGLAVSYVKIYSATNDKEYLKKAVEILKQMKQDGTLLPTDEKWLRQYEEELGE
jgi:translation initiation factor 2B subunit (eIF-2B alpha/beta/delta family)